MRNMLKVDPDNLSEEDLEKLYDNTTGEGFPLISQADLPDKQLIGCRAEAGDGPQTKLA